MFAQSLGKNDRIDKTPERIKSNLKSYFKNDIVGSSLNKSAMSNNDVRKLQINLEGLKKKKVGKSKEETEIKTAEIMNKKITSDISENKLDTKKNKNAPVSDMKQERKKRINISRIIRQELSSTHTASKNNSLQSSLSSRLSLVSVDSPENKGQMSKYQLEGLKRVLFKNKKYGYQALDRGMNISRKEKEEVSDLEVQSPKEKKGQVSLKMNIYGQVRRNLSKVVI